MTTQREKSNTLHLENLKFENDISGIRERTRALTQPILNTESDISFRVKEEVLKRMTNQKESYPTYQIPPSIELALQNQKSKRPTKKIHSDPLKAGTSAPSPSFLYPTSKMTHQGDTLPLYFNFLYYALALSIIFSINQLIFFYMLVDRACEEYYYINDCNLGLGILFLDVDMPQEAFLKVCTSDLMQVVNIVTIIGFVVVNVTFERAQSRIRLLSKSCLCASHYTVMIGNVGVGDSDQKIKDYVEEKAKRIGELDDLDILKINRTSVTVTNTSIQKKRKNLEKTIDSLKKYRSTWTPGSGSSISNEQCSIENVKIIDRKITQVQKALKALETNHLKKCKDFMKPCTQWMRSTSSSIAFVTISDASHVRKLIKNKTRIRCCCCRLRCCGCQKKYKLMEAPRPADVSWDNVGFVTISRYLALTATSFVHIFCLVNVGSVISDLFVVYNNLKDDYSKSFILLICASFLFWLVIKVYIVLITFLMKFVTGVNRFLSKNGDLASLSFRNSFIESTYFQSMVVVGKAFINSRETNEEVIDARNRLAKLIASYLFLSCLILGPVVFTFTYDRIYKYINWKLCFDHFRRKKDILEKGEGSERNGEGSENLEKIEEIAQKKKDVKLTRFDVMTQKELNELLELPECPIDEHYSYICSIMIISLPLNIFPPAVTISCLMIIILQLIFDKWLFYYHYKPYTGSTYSLSNTLITVSELILRVISMIFFFTNSIRMAEEGIFSENGLNLLELSTLIYLFFFLLIPYRFIKRLINSIIDIFVGNEEKYVVTLPNFEDVEPFLATDYDRENPITSTEALRRWSEISSKVEV